MKKLATFIKFGLILFLASACTTTTNPDAGNASDYFPILSNVKYVYQGDGNEYASYDVNIDYNDTNHIQQRINNGGSETVEVIKIEDGQVSLVYRQGETYYRENFLAKDEMTEVLLQDPIETGTTWEVDSDVTRTITSIDTTVETPDRNYSAIVVTTEGPDYQTVNYYAKDVGLVKSEYQSDGTLISSLLSSIEEDVPLSQAVNFYYPNIDDDNYYYKTVMVDFYTNEDTGTTLAQVYKDQTPDQLGQVLTENTMVNEYYLASLDVVALDLSGDFLTEMNAGSGYEGMMLQSIANTFGAYYMVNNVNLTIDGNLYESGHFAFMEGEYLTVDTINALDIEELDNDPVATTYASDYFPIMNDYRYYYQGSGSEYASYEAYIDYSNDNLFQLRVNNGATQTVSVIKVETDLVSVVFEQNETYYRENFLAKTNTETILLKGPIVVGNSWTREAGVTSTITNGAVSITTPSGIYTAIEVTTEYPEATIKDYYVKDVGLVKSISSGTNWEVSAVLETVEADTPLVQSIAFYYPNINDDNIYYAYRDISFHTNEMTKLVLQNAYKEEIENQPGTVFSANTAINWYYLHQDGRVYLDLNQTFITEMNAGAGYESMILQCLADTFGGYYGVDEVALTIDGGLYESGHIALDRFEYLDVNTGDAFDLASLVDVVETDVASYFPILENTHYIYEGDGNEYAAYDVYLDYATATKMQQRINNGGTEVVRVLNIETNQATLVYNRAETYYRENSLTKTNTSDILLQGPIAVGTTWQSAAGTTRTITALNVAVSTPSGDYTAIEVTNAAATYENIDYYVGGVGLVKQVSRGEGYEVTSTLATIETDVPLVQNIQFYYPNINDDTIYFKNREISFYTNDVTRITLQNAYKEDFAGRPGTVFSANTKINWYYLNRDGMAYLDLSGEYLSEMNAGAYYESMMLQCLANTFGSYYQVDRLLLTIDGGLYESGHIALNRFESVPVGTSDSIPLD